jgi:hypothetical protein
MMKGGENQHQGSKTRKKKKVLQEQLSRLK